MLDFMNEASTVLLSTVCKRWWVRPAICRFLTILKDADCTQGCTNIVCILKIMVHKGSKMNKEMDLERPL